MLRRSNLTFFFAASTPILLGRGTSKKSTSNNKKLTLKQQKQQLAQKQESQPQQKQEQQEEEKQLKQARRIAPRIQHEGNERDESEDESKLRVGVLQPHNEGTWGEDDIRCSPALFSSEKLKKEFSYETFTIRKQSAYKQLRQITSEDKCDVFWNLCDGARDENRTGEDTVKILESLNAPFTGADSLGFEPSKIEMKMLLAAAGIKTPNFAVLDRSDLVSSSSSSSSHSKKSQTGKGDAEDSTSSKSNSAKNNEGIVKACSHLRFPVIVKHISGYGSVGITKDSKCETMLQLVKKVRKFVNEFDVALVEEFVTGTEGTVFVCGDENSPTGCHVFAPLMIPVPGGPSEFLHFDKKWKDLKALEADYLEEGEAAASAASASSGGGSSSSKATKKNSSTDDKKSSSSDDKKEGNVNTTEANNADNYHFLEKGKPLTDKIQKMAANAFIHIMHGVGYGRCDFRIDEVTKEPLFLEINPNCGIFLPHEKTGKYEEGYGDFADLMIEQEWGHDKFIRAQLELAMKQQRARIPWWTHSYSSSAGSFLTKSVRNVPRLTRVFGDEVRPIPVVARTLYDCTVKHRLSDDSLRVGCVISRADTNTNNSVMLQHSCKPNCALVHSNTVELATIRNIAKGEILSIDYATLRDGDMPSFRCSCGADNCRGIVKAQAPKIRGERQSSSSSSSDAILSSSSSSSLTSASSSSSQHASPMEVMKKSIQSVKIANEGFETEVVKSKNYNNNKSEVATPTTVVTRKMLKKRKKQLKALRLKRKQEEELLKRQQQQQEQNDTKNSVDKEAETKSTNKK